MQTPIPKSQYLDKSFDYKKLTKDQLRSILFAHNVKMPPISAQKATLLTIYKLNIFDKINELSKEVEPDGSGIEVMSNFSTENVFQTPRKTLAKKNESLVNSVIRNRVSGIDKESKEERGIVGSLIYDSINASKTIEGDNEANDKKLIDKANENELINKTIDNEAKQKTIDKKASHVNNSILDDLITNSNASKINNSRPDNSLHQNINNLNPDDSNLTQDAKNKPITLRPLENSLVETIFLTRNTFCSSSHGPDTLVETPRRLKKIIVAKEEIPNTYKETILLLILLIYVYFRHFVGLNPVPPIFLERFNFFELPFLILFFCLIIIFLSKKNEMIKERIGDEVERVGQSILEFIRSMEQEGKCVSVEDMRSVLGMDKRVWKGVEKKIMLFCRIGDGIVAGKKCKVWELRD